MTRAAAKPPERIGAYRVIRLLGRGGMGEVFLGLHDLLERHVAIKRFISKDAAEESGKQEERFLREGKALAGLSHSSIVGIHDFFSHRGSLYMVLEYVDGYTVSQLVEQGALPIDVACILGLRVAEALQCAHYHRIVHRDVKASNVMVSRRGDVKLMDFGIARDERFGNVTQTGLVVGTPMFVPPEVVKGEVANELSDVYMFGALLYFCLSGRRIFDHASIDNLYAMIAAGRIVPLRRVSQGVPRALRQIVHRCLARRPDKRFASAAEVRQALEIFLAGRGAWANHEERLVGFLKARGHLTELEASTWIRATDLVVTSEFERAPPSRSLRWALMAGMFALGGALVWYADETWFTRIFHLFVP